MFIMSLREALQHENSTNDSEISHILISLTVSANLNFLSPSKVKYNAGCWNWQLDQHQLYAFDPFMVLVMIIAQSS